MVVTEVGCMGVKPGLDIMDQDTAAGSLLTTAWKTVLRTRGGPRRVYWGLEMEDTSKVWAFFDWDSVKQHEEFAKVHGAEAVKDIPQICTHGEFTKHISITPSTDIMQSPLIEVILAYFPPNDTQDMRHKTSLMLQAIVTKAFAPLPDVRGLAHGWGLEDDFPIRGREGHAGLVCFGFIGWSSVKAQSEFRETHTYGEAIASIKAMDDILSAYLFRMACHHLERV